ncbi:MAG: hypothetical protein PUE01_08980 [Clostridiaceae bacterium]|nr:hypothetical protein [Clostridiaceae bacterium]
MAKPSIFSKNYEQKMKKRKKRILIISILAVVIVGIVIFNTQIKNMDFSNIRAKMQAWVDSDKPDEEVKSEEAKNPVVEEPKEEIKEPEKLYMDINISEGIVAKAEYEETEGKKQFINVEPIDGITINISPSKDKILFLDKNQDLKIADINGDVKDISKKQYVSQSNQVFPKEQILTQTPTYIWCAQAKFIDESKIVYVSELPYFGNGGQKLYVWIYDIESGIENVIWNLVGPNIVIGDVVSDKGISVTVNNVQYYLAADGNVTQ